MIRLMTKGYQIVLCADCCAEGPDLPCVELGCALAGFAGDDQLRVVIPSIRAALTRTIDCVWCGHSEPRRADWDQDRIAMATHIAGCTRHPMRAMADELHRIRRYVRHLPECAVDDQSWRKCDCGLDRAE